MINLNNVKYDETAQKKYKAFKMECEALIEAINVRLQPSTRTKSITLTKIEEMHMWLNKAIRDDQIERNMVEGEEMNV